VRTRPQNALRRADSVVDYWALHSSDQDVRKDQSGTSAEWPQGLGTSDRMSHEMRRRLRRRRLLSSAPVSDAEGFPSETHVKRGDRVVHGNKELLERLGNNDPCPCGSGRRFQAVLP
jgi:uncharacterized protein YecA (UPF0149 family)